MLPSIVMGGFGVVLRREGRGGALVVAVWLVLVFPLGRAAAAEADPERRGAELITPAADRAIERGLEFLASRQHDDGSFGSGRYQHHRSCL